MKNCVRNVVRILVNTEVMPKGTFRGGEQTDTEVMPKGTFRGGEQTDIEVMPKGTFRGGEQSDTEVMPKGTFRGGEQTDIEVMPKGTFRGRKFIQETEILKLRSRELFYGKNYWGDYGIAYRSLHRSGNLGDL